MQKTKVQGKRVQAVSRFDIRAFALPNTPAGEVWFEQVRDITEVVVRVRGVVPGRVGLSYRRHQWPRRRFEEGAGASGTEVGDPGAFGWLPMDDWFNGEWQAARIRAARQGSTVAFRFLPLSREGHEGIGPDYDVDFRRTLALRIDGIPAEQVESIAVYTRSPAARSQLRVELDAGKRTPGRRIAFETYNAVVAGLHVLQGVRVRENSVLTGGAARRVFAVDLAHMDQVNPYAGDDGHLTLRLDRESFTVSLADLRRQGPVWFVDQGVYVTLADATVSFEDYRGQHGRKPILDTITARGDQSFAGAFYGQVRGHSVNFNLGCKHSPQRFRIEPTGDVLLNRQDINARGRLPDAEPRYRASANAQFFFGLGRWIAVARSMDPAPVPISNLHLQQGGLQCEQRAVCVPVMKSVLAGELTFNEPTALLVRFRFRNAGDMPVKAVLPLSFSESGWRYTYGSADSYRLPRPDLLKLTPVAVAGGRVTSRFGKRTVLRATVEGTMAATRTEAGPAWVKRLGPGETCELLVKIPFIDLDTPSERRALQALDFDRACREVAAFWRREIGAGCTLTTPIPPLNAVHAAHGTYVEFSDNVIPGAPHLITTSVGSSTYTNFINEACMIIQELDQRGFTDGVRRRLQLYVAAQGEARQPGNFTDFDGAFFGAKGWECGDYNQHHGWALWYLAEHYRMSRDARWFATVAGAVVKGADWVFRQRRNTRKPLPHSRGWERGFLPAGSLEDVTDFYYWLSTNVLTWRATDAAAQALERFGHAEAARVRRESDAYRRDLIRGLELNRTYAPVVKLRDGRWVPHYPSRLYCRGRDTGWIREVLEGAVYLLISGLYGPRSRQADWILHDYADNLYHKPPYGYAIRDPERNVWARGGFSMQPNLLAGLMPHLDRDEIEIYLWMFFNAFVSTYREEVNGMVEHPLPELGFDNSATIKTSDEANSVMWLRYMLVYSTPEYLHLGRALPRAWLKNGEETRIERVRTAYGEVDARWISKLSRGELVFEGNLRGPQDAPRVWVRFRHPDKTPIRAVTVNGRAWRRFDAAKGDVDITGLRGRVGIVARYNSGRL